MSNMAITRDEALLGTSTICPNCTSEIEYFISETNSEYSYCKICNYNSSIIKKHIIFDKILKSMQKHFTKVNNNNISKLKISIKISNGYVSLYINNENIYEVQSLFTINNKDISIFKNTINDLIEDSFEEGSIESSVSIYI